MGHEFAGVIAGIGPGVTRWKVGRQSGSPALRGMRRMLLVQKRADILVPHAYGVHPWIKDSLGAYAEYVGVPEYQLYPLPETISFEQAAQLEPITVCLHMMDLAELRIGDHVLIYGAGPLGLLTFQLARMAGANEIYVVEKSKYRREKASEIGGEHVFAPEEFAASNILKLLPRKGVDVVFECAGVQSTIQGSFEAVRKGGRILLLGISPEPVQLDHFKWIVKGVEVRASIGYFDADFGRALNLLANGQIEVDKLVSDVISLDDIVARGFKKLLSPEGVLKILVNPEM